MTERHLAQALVAPRKHVQGRGLLSSLGNYLGGVDRDDLMPAAKAATLPSETIHNMPFAVDAETVCDAMIAADACGRAFREATGTSSSEHWKKQRV